MAHTTHILRNKRVRAKNGYVLSAEQLAKREKVFGIYRDMGRARSLGALERELKRDYPELAVSHPTIGKWSKQHQWQERVKAHDEAVRDQVMVQEPPSSARADRRNCLTAEGRRSILDR